MNEEVLKKLYASAKRFFDMPAYEVFASDMADEQKLIRFRESMAKHYDMPDIETFKSDIGFGAVKKKEPTDPFGGQEPMESPIPPSQEPISSDSSSEPGSPTAPIDPTTGLPYEDKETTQTTDVDVENDAGLVEEDVTTTTTRQTPRDQTTETYGSGDFFIEGSQEKDTYLEQALGKNSITDFIGDIYRAGKQGFVQGNTTDEAIDLMFQGADATDTEILDFLEAQDRLAALGQTDEMANFNNIYDNSENKVTGFLQGIAKNPSVIFQLAAQTVTQLANEDSLKAAGTVIGTGAAVGGGLALSSGIGAPAAGLAAVAGALNPATLRTAFAAASTTLETGLSFAEFLREEVESKGLEFNEEGIKAVLNDADSLTKIKLKSVARGGVIGIVDRLSLGAAGKIVKSMKPASTAAKQFRKELGVNLASEFVGGGAGESLARAAAGQEQDVRDIGLEAIGGFGRAPISYAINAMRKKPEYSLTDSSGNKITRTKDQIDFIIDDTDDDTFMGLNIDIKNDPDLKERYDKRYMRIRTGDNIRQKLKEAGIENKEQQDKIIELEIEKNKYEGNNTEAGKEKLKEVKQKIAEASEVIKPKTDKENAVQKSSTEEVSLQKPTEDSQEMGAGDNVRDVTIESETTETPEGEQTTEVVEEIQEELDPDKPVEGGDGRTPRQIAGDIFAAQEKRKERRSDREEIEAGEGMEQLFGQKFSYESLKKYFGGNPYEFVGKRYIAVFGDKNAPNIDDGMDINGQEIGPDEIADFISQYRTQKDIDAYFETDRTDLNNLLVEFEEATGLKPTKKIIESIINAPPAEVKLENEVKLEEAKSRAQVEENVDLMNEVGSNILASLNQGFRKGLSSIRDYLKTLKNDGKISSNQARRILEQVIDENAFKDDDSRNKTVEKIKDIFRVADKKAEESTLRKKAKKALVAIKRSIGRIMADDNSGNDISLEAMLSEILVIDPTVIPAKVYQQYKDIVNELGERLLMPDNAEDAGVMAERAKEIMEAVILQESKIPELKSLFDSIDPIRFKNGKVDFKKTIAKLIKDGIISEEEAELMGKYKAEVNPKEAKTPKTEEQKQEERDELVGDISVLNIDKKRSDEKSPLSFPFRKTREDIRELTRLIKNRINVEGLNTEDLKNLIRSVDLINKGYAPGIVSRLISKMQAVEDTTPLIKKMLAGKIKLKGIENIYSTLKTYNPFNKQSKLYNALERTQLANLDKLFGNFKTKDIFNSFFKGMAEEQQQMDTANKKERKLRDKVRSLLESSYSKLGVIKNNLVAEADARLMFYRIQLEFESNPTDKKVRPALDWLDSTIKYLEANRMFDKQDAREVEVLKKIREDYAKEDFSLDNIYNSFDKNEKEAIKILQEIDNANTEKAVYAAHQRDAAFVPRKNYVHISVRPQGRERIDINKDVIADFIKDSQVGRSSDNRALSSVIKSKAGIERTGAVNPIYTSAINSSERGSKFTNLDYYMTTPVRKSRQSIKYVRETIIKDTDGSPPVNTQALLEVLDQGVNKALQNVLLNNFVENDFMAMVSSAMTRFGYRTMLASAPRAAVEYISNMSFAFLHPSVYYEGVLKKNKMTTDEFVSFLQNIKSKNISRLTGENLMSSKVDTDILQKKSYKGERFMSDSKDKVVGIWDATGKKFKNAIALIADTLISSPDKMVMRPMEIGKFSQKFKEVSGKDVDWKKIIANDEAYMTENKEAIESARDSSDEFVSLIGATDNPFMSRLQGKDAEGLSKLWFNFNNFMVTFLKQEFDTAAAGTQAIFQTENNPSNFSRKEGAQLLAAVNIRMMAYSLGIKVAGELMLEAFGIESEDEEKDLEQQLGQAFATTFTSLIVGRNFGNATKTIQNYLIEMANAEYGGGLRTGEYDQYRDAIQYSLIPQVRTGQDYKSGKGVDLGKLAPNFLGPYSPPVKTLALTAKKFTEPARKTIDAKERQDREKFQRVPVEILGNTGFVPLYRDVRKILLADIYQGMGKKQEGVYSKEELEKLKKENPRKYKDVVYKKKMERYDKAYKNYIDYKRSPRSWKDANPGKKAPRRPKRPRR